MVLSTSVLICFHFLQWTAFISIHIHTRFGKKEEEEMEESGDNGGEREESDGEGMEGERGDYGGDIEAKEDRRGDRGRGRGRIGKNIQEKKSKSHTPSILFLLINIIV